DDPFKLVGMLSGGEQSRVRLMKLILTCPNVLVLDEPTNHLDIPSREVLEEALLEFGGTIIVVSHDRYFLDRICTRLLGVRPEGGPAVDGTSRTSTREVEQERATPSAAATKAKAAEKAAAAPAKAGKPKSRFAKMELAAIEAFIIEREARLEQIHSRFGDP